MLLASDPIVTVDTNFGNFQIQLNPTAAPQTVANFLKYVDSGAYTDTIFHRSVQPTSSQPNIGIVQAGGFTSASATFSGNASQFSTIATNPPVSLEYNLPNSLGSVAMARTSDVNSATDEWFINDTDNSTSLGASNGGGYAVFGQVLGNGMQVVNQIASLPTSNVDNGAFSQLPLGLNNQLVQVSSITVDSIDGTIFSDTNGNGTLDTGEPGVAGRTVFLDNDHTGVPDGNNPSTTTDANGNYTFTGLAAGTYTVREQISANVSLTVASQTVTVAADQTATAVNFAEQPSITGTVFTDTNANGALDSGETGISGRTVFLNIDNSGQPDSSNPSTTTDANGKYSFSGLAPGSYTVRELIGAGTTLSTPTQSITVSGGQVTSSVNFGEVPPSIVGTVFTDVNNNGTYDAGDVGIGGRTVFLDINGSGQPGGTNTSTTTDSLGRFSFGGLAAGNYTVKELLASGATLSTPAQSISVTAGQTTSGVNFGEMPSITGQIFTDVNGNGQADTGEPGVSGRQVFINVDGSGVPDTGNPTATSDSSGKFTFSGLAAGTYTVQEALPSNVTLSTPAQTFTVAAGQAAAGALFGEIPSITGSVFADLNGDGQIETGEPGAAGRTVFIDEDHTGQPDASNPSTTTDANGNYSFTGVAPGSYTVMAVLPANVTLSTPTQAITVVAGQTTSAVNFGDKPAITGTLFTDSNGNARLDSGEAGISGRTVFINNDGTGAPDLQNPSATTDANGNYFFVGLSPGSYNVMEEAATGTSFSTNTTAVAVSAGHTTAGVNIGEGTPSNSSGNSGNTPGTGSISGMVFDDLNFDGQFSAGDPGIAGRTVFLNNDGSGVPDAKNPSTTTDAAGNYSFSNLAAGSYTVQEVVAADHGVTLTTPLSAVTVTAGQPTTGVNLGDALTSTLAPLTVSTTPAASSTSTDPNTAYINAIYQSLLGRAPDASSLSYWQGQLAGGAARDALVRSVWDSAEHRGLEIDQFYQTFLGRAADPAGKAYWLNAFANWGTEENVIATFVTSDEYSNRLHAGNTDYINALYTDIDLRAADHAGLAAWQTALDNGESRLQVATAFINGQEASGEIVDAYFADFLHRTADTSGRQDLINALTNNAASLNSKSIEDVGIQVLAADEYFARVSGG